ARRVASDGRGPRQQRDRQGAVRLRQGRREAQRGDLHQAGPARRPDRAPPPCAGRARLPAGSEDRRVVPGMRGARPPDLVATVPPEGLVAALVRNLAETVGGQATYGLPAGGSGAELTVLASWPVLSAGRVGVAGDVVREPVAGGGVMLVTGPRRWGDGEHAILRETAAWLGLAARLDRLRADHDRAAAPAPRPRAQL